MLTVIIVTLVSIALMLGVFPLLLKLRPNRKINFLEVDEESFIKMDEDLNKNFEVIKLVKDEDGNYTSMVIQPKENVTYADITLAIKDTNNKIKIRGYRLKFKDFRNLEIEFGKQISSVAIYVNQINFGEKKEHIIQHLDRKNLEAFIALEWVGAAMIVSISLYDILIHSYVLDLWVNYNDRSVNLPLTILFAFLISGLMYLVIHYVSYWYFGKYVYGGKFDDRN